MNKLIDKKNAKLFFDKLGNEFAIISNPDFVFPEKEIIQLAPIITKPLNKLKAVVMDMDGTTTTTEELCTFSLEMMIRKITGWAGLSQWEGLDHKMDFPNIIGNSTTKHVEYLIKKYGHGVVKKELTEAFIYSALWTLLIGRDSQRKLEVRLNMANFGLSEILNDNRFITLLNENSASEKKIKSIIKILSPKYDSIFSEINFNDIVKASIDIYYQKYHEILFKIDNGDSLALNKKFLGDKNKHLVEPMPGIPIFLALIKGMLGEDVKFLLKNLINFIYPNQSDDRPNNLTTKELLQLENNLIKLSLRFQKNPLKIAIVTSSIHYEADIVLKELFKVIREEISEMPLPAKRKSIILENFSDHNKFYDAFVTANDSNEIRLKPYRDLYSIALHQLGVSKNEFNQVIGLEDSESGTIAIRAAGIGLSVAVPFTKTSGHNFDAAAYIAKEGIPEIILKQNCFLK